MGTFECTGLLAVFEDVVKWTFILAVFVNVISHLMQGLIMTESIKLSSVPDLCPVNHFIYIEIESYTDGGIS